MPWVFKLRSTPQKTSPNLQRKYQQDSRETLMSKCSQTLKTAVSSESNLFRSICYQLPLHTWGQATLLTNKNLSMIIILCSRPWIISVSPTMRVIWRSIQVLATYLTQLGESSFIYFILIIILKVKRKVHTWLED